MNHDMSHCADFCEDCPKECWRAELTRDALKNNWTMIDWAHFKGTEECKRKEVTE